MTDNQLESISIRNFRSIGGEFTVPLNAQIVLVHGQNGAGKTSLLSGLEFALTGSIDALRRIDSDYKTHLLHRSATEASVSVTARLDNETRSTTCRVNSGEREWTSQHLLDEADSTFYSDRSYLAQATLGRLLEIYESNELSQDTALTRFVNDVLGLNVLDNVISGLHRVSDIRRARQLVPEIKELEHEISREKDYISTKRDQLIHFENQLENLRDEILILLSRLDRQVHRFSHSALEQALSQPERNFDDSQLALHVRYRHEIQIHTNQLNLEQRGPDEKTISLLELRSDQTTKICEQWFASYGREIEEILDQARPLFPDLASIWTTSPSDVVTTSIDRFERELIRCTKQLADDDRRQSEIEQLQFEAERAANRIELADEQLNFATSGAAEISRALAEIIPHLHDSECILCGRDYSEISDTPLAEKVIQRVSKLDEQARRISALVLERQDAVLLYNNASNDKKEFTAQLLGTSARSNLTERKEVISGWVSTLSELEPASIVGSQAILARSKDSRQLESTKIQLNRWWDARQNLRDLSATLEIDPVGDSEPFHEAVFRVSNHIQERIVELENRATIRRKLEGLHQRQADLVVVIESTKLEIAESQRRNVSLTNRISIVGEKLDSVRRVQKSALAVKKSIVDSVFNESLNKLWRDLFVRLAPNEPFVPAFYVSDAKSGSSPQISTMHSDGNQGGSPGTMLSAGNLNTAALTLFLALHLSAGQRLPFIVLDDPVQSMDDVHISQFAALLRTLSKQHGRQVIIAVHERTLFDYLTLELSPAFDGDSLIAVELKKRTDGSTVVESTRHDWLEDTVQVPA